MMLEIMTGVYLVIGAVLAIHLLLEGREDITLMDLFGVLFVSLLWGVLVIIISGMRVLTFLDRLKTPSLFSVVIWKRR